MNRSVRIALLITAVVLLLLFALFGPRRDGGVHDWRENYKPGSKEPYGTHVIRQMMEGYFPGAGLKEITESLPQSLPLHKEGGASYVFIGEAMFLDSADVSHLRKFVDYGNDVFIASKSLPFDLMFYVYFEECNYTPWNGELEVVQDTLAEFQLLHEDLWPDSSYTYLYRREERNQMYRWHYIDSVYFCGHELGFMELGQSWFGDGQPYINFARIKYEDTENGFRQKEGGHFYLHSNPLAFTNFQMLRPEAKAYAERVFSHLKAGPIYWDKYSQTSEGISRAFNRRNANNANPALTLSDESPLRYILGNRHLSWAWYSLATLGLLYLMFRAKRRQGIIPVLRGNENSSLEFISTIGAMYHNKQNHRKLSVQKMKIFLADIRHRYAISTAHQDDAFFQQLSMRSGVEQGRLRKFFQFYGNIEKSSYVSDDSLQSFHKEMQEISRAFK